MPYAFDKDPIYKDCLLALDFQRATGVIAEDLAKPHHPCTLTGPPTWSQLANGLTYLDFNSAIPDFIESPAVDTVDLDFTSEDFSVALWFNADSVAGNRGLIYRGISMTDGWYFLILSDGRLQFTTNQAAASQSSRTTPGDIVTSVWYFAVVTRDGASGRIYINGTDVTTSPLAHINPLTANRELHIGIRDNEVNIPFDGKIWFPRIWGRKLEPKEPLIIFERERDLFGV